MITRAQIRRQLRKNGGIMNAVPRQGYGIGDFVRKLIPKEIAKVSQVAAPFVAPFNPLAGAAMAGLGGFKQTGNLGRSLGAAALTGGLGAGARYLGGAKQILPGIGGFSSPLSVGKTASLFGTPGHMSRNTGWMKGTEGFLDKLGLTKGGGSMKMTPLGMISGASLLTYFMQKGATEEEAEELARDVYRGKGLGMNQIKADMQKYRSGVLSASQAHDMGYHFLTPRNYLGAQGGRVGLANGSEGVKQMYVSDDLGALPKKGGGVLPEDMGKLKKENFDSEADYKRYLKRLNKKAKGGRNGYQEGTPAVDPRMHLPPEENIRLNKLQTQMNQRVRSGQGISASGHGLGGLELRNRFIPDASGEMPQFSGYGVKPQAYNLNNPSMTPSYNQIYASYRNQGLSPSQIKAMAYADTTQSTYGDIAPLPMAGDPYNPLSLDKFFTTQGDLDAHYQEGLRRQMLEGSPEVYWDQGSREYKLHDSEYLRNLYNQPSEFEKLSGYKTEKEAIDAMGIEAYNRLMAQGGRVGKYGGGIGAAMPRIPTGMPRVNAGGITELDYRQEGGFVPMGVKEKADDVPAMLSKNEFVMTADAVKAAGGGDVEKGAQRMYDTMKQLEGRVA